jgi:hypothetical protein
MTSDGEITKIKVLGLKNLYTFVVDNFSFEIIYLRKIMFEFPHIWNLTSQKMSDGEMT